MFSGIVQESGTIEDLKSHLGILDLSVSSKDLFKKLKLGSSVSIDGCCQTVVKIQKSDNLFIVQATEETLNKTIFKNYKKGSKVNLETSLSLGDEIAGHLVSGHVDTKGEVLDIKLCGENKIVEICYPKTLSKYIAPKGSITVNGVSLTVIEAKNDSFTFTLIPYTASNTNLGFLKLGDPVNLEIDLLSRYVVNCLEQTHMNKLNTLK